VAGIIVAPGRKLICPGVFFWTFNATQYFKDLPDGENIYPGEVK
jgi:hypothetical protein